MTRNPLLKTLRLIEILSVHHANSETLGCHLNISTATVKSHLAKARSLGADILSVREIDGWRYELRNGNSVMARVRLWIDLEEKQDLVTYPYPPKWEPAGDQTKLT